jgi:hypothetical protein
MSVKFEVIEGVTRESQVTADTYEWAVSWITQRMYDEDRPYQYFIIEKRWFPTQEGQA